ncbi:MAG: hypothetical protein V6Z78_02445 [Holosporaceae bacterium]
MQTFFADKRLKHAPHDASFFKSLQELLHNLRFGPLFFKVVIRCADY